MRLIYLQLFANEHKTVGYLYALNILKKKKVTSDSSPILTEVNASLLVTGIPTENQKSHRK